MSVEALVLAVASAVRPSTSLAAVYALLSTSRPRQLLLPFIVAGFAFSAAIGILVVSVVHGVALPGGSSQFKAIVNVVAGVAALGFAAGVLSGRVMKPRRRGEAREPSWPVRRLRYPSLKIAAAAGVMTHVPGLLYLVALNAIAADEPRLRFALVEVLVYNAIWFAVPIAAFVLARRRPGRTQAVMDRMSDWGRRHEQGIVVALFGAVGAFLTVNGLVDLAT